MHGLLGLVKIYQTVDPKGRSALRLKQDDTHAVRVAAFRLPGKDVAGHTESVTQSLNTTDWPALPILGTNHLAADLPGEHQLKTKRIMNLFDEISLDACILAGAPTDGTILDICVMRIGVLYFVVSAGTEPVILTYLSGACHSHLFDFAGRQRTIVVAHVKGMGMLEGAPGALNPRLQVLDPDLEVAC